MALNYLTFVTMVAEWLLATHTHTHIYLWLELHKSGRGWFSGWHWVAVECAKLGIIIIRIPISEVQMWTFNYI